MKTERYGSGAVWGTTGASWTGNNEADFPTYTVTIEAPKFGLSGTITLASVSTGKYACATTPYLDDKTTLEALPGLGWTNQVPAATAAVRFTVDNAAEVAFDDAARRGGVPRADGTDLGRACRSGGRSRSGRCR